MERVGVVVSVYWISWTCLAVVAVNTLARIALVCVFSEIVTAFGDVEVLGGNDLVQSECGPRKLLARVAVTIAPLALLTVQFTN